MTKKNNSYTPAPRVPREQMERLAVILEVLAGKRSVSEGARTLGLSRNHFQTLLHRGLEGLVEGIAAKRGGRPAKPARQAAMETELLRLRRENAHLQERVGTTDRLLKAASGLLHGRLRPTGRQVRAKKTAPNDGGSEPEPDAGARRKLEAIAKMKQLGLPAPLAAAVAGVHACTVRRWRARERLGQPLVQRGGAARAPCAHALRDASALVRRLNGQVGAESIRRSVHGISRREAARVKARTLTEMERERKGALTRVLLTTPGVVRGMDGMYFRSTDGRLHALFTADAAIPYRTSVKTGAHYDASLVADTLRSDIEHNGAPLVYRLDRASAHDAPPVRQLLEEHQVLVLHGPPRCPRFYGQHERQNREHRAWEAELARLPAEQIEPRLREILVALNAIWRRRALNWRTASEAWARRPMLTVDRKALREEVSEQAARIARQLQHRGRPADLAERLAIEQALETRGYLRQQIGGWC